MLEEAIEQYIEQMDIECGDNDLLIKQLVLDATLIACRIQEERAIKNCRPFADNDN